MTFSHELEKELLSFGASQTLQECLKNMNILDAEDTLTQIREVLPWERRGAETYFSLFEVVSAKSTTLYVMKALVPFSLATSVELATRKWLYRRQLITDRGVLVPRLYGVHKGTLIEQYLRFAVSDLTKGNWNANMRRQVFAYAQALTELRFCAVSPFSDLRTDGYHVYAVDFGEDLGDPDAVGRIPEYTELAHHWIQKLAS